MRKQIIKGTVQTGLERMKSAFLPRMPEITSDAGGNMNDRGCMGTAIFFLQSFLLCDKIRKQFVLFIIYG